MIPVSAGLLKVSTPRKQGASGRPTSTRRRCADSTVPTGAAACLRCGADPPRCAASVCGVLLCFAQPFGALSLLGQRAPVQSDRAVNYVAKVKSFNDELFQVSSSKKLLP